MNHRTRVAIATILVMATLGLFRPGTVLAEDDLGASGIPQASDQITQLTQTVQQLVQTVQQLTGFVGTIFSQASGSLFGPGGTPPFLGSVPGVPSLPFGSWLGQLQQWLSNVLYQTGSVVWTEFGTEWGQAPDYVYSTTQIVSEIQQLATQLPGQVGQWLAQLAQRLASAAAPLERMPQWDAGQVVQTNPTFASRAHAVQQAQVASTAAQAEARVVAQQSHDLAQQATSDTSAQSAAGAAQEIARETAAAVQSTPSTRAAVEVMAASLTQQQAQAISAQATIASKLDALITQHAQLAAQLAGAVGGLGTVSGLLSQQLTQSLENQAQSSVTTQDTISGAAAGIAGQLNFIANGGDQQSFNDFFTISVSAP
jgi:hypothetical protein